MLPRFDGCLLGFVLAALLFASTGVQAGTVSGLSDSAISKLHFNLEDFAGFDETTSDLDLLTSFEFTIEKGNDATLTFLVGSPYDKDSDGIKLMKNTGIRFNNFKQNGVNIFSPSDISTKSNVFYWPKNNSFDLTFSSDFNDTADGNPWGAFVDWLGENAESANEESKAFIEVHIGSIDGRNSINKAKFTFSKDGDSSGEWDEEPSTAPEPATLLMFGGGMLGLGWAVRRRNKK